MPSVLHRHGSPMIPSSWGPANLTWFSSLNSRAPRTAQRPGLGCPCAALTVRATDDHRLWPRPHGEQGSSHATGPQGPPTLGTSFPGGCPGQAGAGSPQQSLRWKAVMWGPLVSSCYSTEASMAEESVCGERGEHRATLLFSWSLPNNGLSLNDS